MSELPAQSEHLRSMLGTFFERRITDLIMSLSRPAVRLAHADSAAPCLRGSRLGGTVSLAADAWPRWRGRALDLLGLIDFAEIAGVAGVVAGGGPPTRGTAGFFYATEIPRPWGHDPKEAGGWRVVPVIGGGEPQGSPPDDAITFPGQSLCANPFLSLPCYLEPALCDAADEFGEFTQTYQQVYRAWQRFIWPDGTPRHQIGGWPVLIQRSLWRDCALASAGRNLDDLAGSPDEHPAAVDEWRLLLQLDSDRRLGWRWSTDGAVYFTIRQPDVDAGALERAWLTLQCR